MKLINITEENISFYKQFENYYNENLSIYLSRIYPYSNSVIKWCYINEKNKNIGSIWLEKVDENILKLGIFIAEEKYRNKGFGTLAIKEMLDIAKLNNYKTVTLNVRITNHRAIKAYQNIGFKKTNQYYKNNGIEVISMTYEL